MMDAKDIAELDRLLDRILSGYPQGDTSAAKAAMELRASIPASTAAASNPDYCEGCGAFERSVALASALTVLNGGESNDELENAQIARASNQLLAMECCRLRSALARTELSIAQWRERALSAAGEIAVAEAATTNCEDDVPPWDTSRQRRKLDHIAELIGAFKGSLQWRLGHSLVTLAERVLMRKAQPTALDAAETLARSEGQ